MRSDIANNTAAIRAEIEHMNVDIQDMKGGLWTWSDEVVSTQSTVTSLQKQVVALKHRCEDMEGRMTRVWAFRSRAGGILGIGVLLGCSVVGLSGVNGFGILCGCVGACVFC